jgi:flagellar FliL protein
MAGKEATSADKAQKPSIVGTIVGFLLATLLAGVCGIALVWIMKPEAKVAAASGPKVHAPSAESPAVGLIVKAMPPVLTNLTGDRPGWIKLELLAVLNADTPTPDALAAELSQDVLAYMRTVSHSQIIGPSGIQALREDLDQIARVRSKGKSRGLLIRTLVIE